MNNETKFLIKEGVLIRYNDDKGDVIIPDCVRIIDHSAFSGCSSLTSIIIPDSVIEIGYNAFYGCRRLASIVIPNSVIKIGGSAFSGCSSLTSIIIPDSVIGMGNSVFEGCSGLTSIEVAKGNRTYDSRDNCNAIIETATNALITGCINTIIPDSVTEISKWSFYACSGLTSINIPDSVKVIGYSAFEGCSDLTSINIPDSVTEICSRAFAGCKSLVSVNIPSSITKIGQCAFLQTNIKRQPKGHIAYKGFNGDMTCRGFIYQEGETYTCDEASLCKCGFHACLNPLDCFSYYSDNVNAVYHEVILEDRTGEQSDRDSKICGRKITIGRKLTLKEMAEIFNELNKNV